MPKKKTVRLCGPKHLTEKFTSLFREKGFDVSVNPPLNDIQARTQISAFVNIPRNNRRFLQFFCGERAIESALARL